MNILKVFVSVFCLHLLSLSGYSQAIADCGRLEELYSKQIESNRNDAEYLSGVLRAFREAKCGITPTFQKAAMYLHELLPDRLSAIGCGKYYYTKNNPKKALQLYDNALRYIERSGENISQEAKKAKADVYLYKAEVYFYRLKNLQRARENIMLSLEMFDGQAEPYFLLAEIYVASKVSNDSVLNLSRYWLAADMLERAKKITTTDESRAKADRLLKEYRCLFPTEEQIQNLYGSKEGEIYRIAGWIGRNTICRKRECDDF